MTERVIWQDPNLARKDKLLREALEEQEVLLPMVSLFEISVTGLCNRRCPFCPRHDPAVYPNVNEMIAPELHAKMMRELGELDYTGLIAYSGYSEPLLHRGLEGLIAEARRACPKARIEIYTNGDFLTVERIQTLLAAGLSAILVSLYDGPQQIAHFTHMREAARAPEGQMILRERYKLDEGEGMHLSNRAGTIDFTAMATHVQPLREPLKRKCHLPFYMMMVDHTGDVFLCSHDWVKKHPVGDLNSQTVLEVWNGQKLRVARECLAAGDRRFSPCIGCDVDGTKIGLAHFEQWQAYYEQQHAKHSAAPGPRA